MCDIKIIFKRKYIYSLLICSHGICNEFLLVNIVLTLLSQNLIFQYKFFFCKFGINRIQSVAIFIGKERKICYQNPVLHY